MPLWSGNSISSANREASNIPAHITWFSLVNKAGGTINVNVSLLYGSTNIFLIPANTALSGGQAYISDDMILLPPGYVLRVTMSGSCDYTFAIE